MTPFRGFHRIALPLTAALLLAVLSRPALALDMTTMVIDSISAHPEIKEKIHVYRQVRRDREIADSGWRPSVDIEASTGLYETESPTTGNNSVDYDSSTLELSVTQNLFGGYDTTYQVEQTGHRLQAALYEIYDTADNIALTAIQAYLDVIRQRRLLQLAQENVAAHEDILAQIRERNASGVGRRSQLQQTEGRLARAYASQVAQQNNLEDAATRFHQVLGRYVDPDALSDPELPLLPQNELDALIDRALANHPAMRVADSNIRAAQADHLRSLRTRYPNLDLRFATEYGEDIGGLDGNTEEVSVVLNLTYNLYSGGRNDAEQQKRISAVYEQKEFAARVRRQVINTLRLAWIADTSLERQIGYLRTHVQKAGETVESYQEEFFIGQRDLIDLLDSRNELNSAQNQLAQARYDALGARYRVYEGMGQLFDAADVEFSLQEDQLQVARLTTEKVDKLPLPDDEDQDAELDPLDHCDNTLPARDVNPFGCHQPPVVIKVEAPPAATNTAPEPADDFFEIEANGALIITRDQLLANDRDADGDALEVIDVGRPRVGRLASNPDGNLVYRASEGFVGVDSFDYTVSDDRGASASAKASVQIRVREPELVSLDRAQLVNFVYDEAELTDVSKIKVEAIIEAIRAARDIRIEIYTHTDDIGSDGYNLALSKRRADALKALLVERGIDPADIEAVGMGEAQPIADNSTEAGQAINRRGEFVFKAKFAAE